MSPELTSLYWYKYFVKNVNSKLGVLYIFCGLKLLVEVYINEYEE